MKWLNNIWIYILLLICFACLLANGIVIYNYCSVFSGGISQKISDWNLFMVIFNGIITAVLAVVNIGAIIKINTSIENNNKKRNVKNKIFEAQTILTKMRLEDYRIIKDIINEIKVSIYKKHPCSEKIDYLKKKLMEMDLSFLYKGQKMKDNPFLRSTTENLVVKLEKFMTKVEKCVEVEKNEEFDLQVCLTNFQNMMEFYIIFQLVCDKEVEKYISDNQEYMDCTISLMYDIAKDVAKKRDAEQNNEQN